MIGGVIASLLDEIFRRSLAFILISARLAEKVWVIVILFSEPFCSDPLFVTDMGFGEKAKVSRGKPANQSILMVKFSATLSGLQEAERLSDIYAHRKHGRAEFQHISCGHSGGSDGETKEALTDKVGKILYGYLGIAEDLDKLDFETKKRSSVRSKKQIKDIAVAP